MSQPVNATKARPRGDRYFVINHYKGKNGPRATAHEYPTLKDAQLAANAMRDDLYDLTGAIDLGEGFEVFVGSKSQLDKKVRP